MKEVVEKSKLEGRAFQLAWMGQTAMAHFLLTDVYGWLSPKWNRARLVSF